MTHTMTYSMTQTDIRSDTKSHKIKSSIINFEPRVNLLNTKVVPNPELNEMNVTIEYEIVGIDIPPQQLDFVLLPVR